jgi:soluble lytic murein transglycosylase
MSVSQAWAAKRFDSRTLLPFFSGASARPLRRALRLRACGRAGQAIQTLKLRGRQLRVAQVLVGRCYLSKRNFAESRAWLARARKRLGLLRDYIWYWTAMSFKRERKPLEAARALLRVPGSSLLYKAARLEAGALYLKENKPKRVLAILRPRAWKGNAPDIWWLGFRAARRLRTKEARKTARYLARRIWSRAPSSPAAKKVTALLRRKKLWFRIRVSDRVQRARRFNRIYDYRKALNALRRVRISKKAPKSLRCPFYYARGYAWFRRRSYSRAVRDLLQARTTCRGHKRLDVRSLYRLGQAYRRRGMTASSARYLRELATRFPSSFLADDALFMIADRYDRRGQKEKARKVYKEMMRRFPKGDMVRVARWRLAYQAYRKAKWSDALKRFRTYLRYSSRSKYAPRAWYYMARALEKSSWRKPKAERKKLRAQAQKAYLSLVKKHAMHYYSFMALERLRRYTRKRWKIWRVPLSRFLKRADRARMPTKPPTSKSRWWQYVPWGPLPHRPPTDRELAQMFDGTYGPFLGHVAYRKGLMLYRMGLKQPAGAEWLRLRRCSVLQPKKKPRPRWGCTRRGDPGAELLALHFHLAEEYYLSNMTYRGRGIPAGKMPMRATTVHRWYLSYPRPFYKIAKPAVDADGVDIGMVYGIMREESAFRTETRSWANAHGLMQFIISTARSTARTLWPNRKITAEDLYKPEIGVRLGVRHLWQLFRMFKGQYPLMAGAYNAGPGWVNRWLKRHKYLYFDEWNEAISIKQTRHYVQRVMQTFAIYRYLYLPRKKRWNPSPFVPYKKPAKLMGRIK